MAEAAPTQTVSIPHPNPTAQPTIVAYTHLGYIAGSIASQELYSCDACGCAVAVPGGQALIEEAPDPLELHTRFHAGLVR